MLQSFFRDTKKKNSWDRNMRRNGQMAYGFISSECCAVCTVYAGTAVHVPFLFTISLSAKLHFINLR